MPQDKMQMSDEVVALTLPAAPPQTIIKCTGCKLTITFDDKPKMDIYCPICGGLIYAMGKTDKICSVCKEFVGKDALSCSYCGKYLGGE